MRKLFVSYIKQFRNFFNSGVVKNDKLLKTNWKRRLNLPDNCNVIELNKTRTPNLVPSKMNDTLCLIFDDGLALDISCYSPTQQCNPIIPNLRNKPHSRKMFKGNHRYQTTNIKHHSLPFDPFIRNNKFLRHNSSLVHYISRRTCHGQQRNQLIDFSAKKKISNLSKPAGKMKLRKEPVNNHCDSQEVAIELKALLKSEKLLKKAYDTGFIKPPLITPSSFMIQKNYKRNRVCYPTYSKCKSFYPHNNCTLNLGTCCLGFHTDALLSTAPKEEMILPPQITSTKTAEKTSEINGNSCDLSEDKNRKQLLEILKDFDIYTVASYLLKYNQNLLKKQREINKIKEIQDYYKKPSMPLKMTSRIWKNFIQSNLQNVSRKHSCSVEESGITKDLANICTTPTKYGSNTWYCIKFALVSLKMKCNKNYAEKDSQIKSEVTKRIMGTIYNKYTAKQQDLPVPVVKTMLKLIKTYLYDVYECTQRMLKIIMQPVTIYDYERHFAEMFETKLASSMVHFSDIPSTSLYSLGIDEFDLLSDDRRLPVEQKNSNSSLCTCAVNEVVLVQKQSKDTSYHPPNKNDEPVVQKNCSNSSLHPPNNKNVPVVQKNSIHSFLCPSTLNEVPVNTEFLRKFKIKVKNNATKCGKTMSVEQIQTIKHLPPDSFLRFINILIDVSKRMNELIYLKSTRKVIDLSEKSVNNFNAGNEDLKQYSYCDSKKETSTSLKNSILNIKIKKQNKDYTFNNIKIEEFQIRLYDNKNKKKYNLRISDLDKYGVPIPNFCENVKPGKDCNKFVLLDLKIKLPFTNSLGFLLKQ